METIRVNKNEATAARRRVYFYCVDATDGMTPETGEAGGQPQVSVDGAAFTNTGIGTLVAIGNGRYYAELTQALVNVDNAVIETRYASANTAETPGSTVVVDQKVERLDAAVSTRASQTSVDTVAGYVDTEVAATLAAVDTEVAAIKAKTDNLPASPAATGDIATALNAYDAPTKAELDSAVAPLATGASVAAVGAAIAALDFSTLTAQQVWEYVTRELTSAGAQGATAQEVWEYATRTLSALPTGAATEAKQDTAQADLTTLVARNNPLTAAQTTTAVEAATIDVEATVDAAAIAATIVAALPPVADGTTITEATLDTAGDPLGLVPPNAEVTVYLNGVAKYQFEADADGQFSYKLPTGSEWTLIARAVGYRDTTATVSTVEAVS